MPAVDRCEKCGKPVNKRDAQPARVITEVSAFQSTRKFDGPRVVFHKKCWDPRAIGYQKLNY